MDHLSMGLRGGQISTQLLHGPSPQKNAHNKTMPFH